MKAIKSRQIFVNVITTQFKQVEERAPRDKKQGNVPKVSDWNIPNVTKFIGNR